MKFINRAILPTKQKNMDNKEFNLQILAKLVEFAQEIFQKMTLNVEGTFTAAELYNGKTSWGEKITINYHGDQFNEVYEADVNGFHFKICPFCIFSTLYKFEKLCNVKQKDKARFTFGAAKEVINEKCMYIGKDKKILIRKKSLCRISDNVAYEQIDKYRVNIYYKGGGTWHYIYATQKELLNVGIVKNMTENEKFIIDALAKWDYTLGNQLTPIYKALYDVLRPKPTKDAPVSGKRKTKPENSVTCDVATGQKNNGILYNEQKKLKSIGNNLYKDEDNLYFKYGTVCYCLGGYTRGVALFLKSQGDNISNKIREMIEQGGCLTDSTKILYEKMCKDDTHVKSESVEETHEDYPPEPYNESKCSKVNRHGKIPGQKYQEYGRIYEISRCKTDIYYRATYRPICDHSEKPANKISNLQKMQFANSCGNRYYVLPSYLRQKVFPTELFNARRKISRFKPRYLFRLTSYRLHKESSLERKRISNTSIYRELIRGETGISSG